MEIFRQDDVISLFERLWYKYYMEDKDAHFDNVELRELWYMYKVHTLCELSQYGDAKARKNLAAELNRNGNRFANPRHRILEAEA